MYQIKTTPAEYFFTKNDPKDVRLGDLTTSPNTKALQKFLDSKAKDQEQAEQPIAIFGYADDFGIGHGGGRRGAKEAPLAIRRFFYKCTLASPLFRLEENKQTETNYKLQHKRLALKHTDEKRIGIEAVYHADQEGPISAPPASTKKPQFICDYGNLENQSENDIKTQRALHETAKNIVSSLLGKHQQVFTLGGGHDYAYPDGAAFLKDSLKNKGTENNFALKSKKTSQQIKGNKGQPDRKNPTEKPLIVNLDAHLDVRPGPTSPAAKKGSEQGDSELAYSSGTPFYRLLEEFPGDFSLITLGLQAQCNSLSHIEYAEKKGVGMLFMDDLRLNPVASVARKFKANPAWLKTSPPHPELWPAFNLALKLKTMGYSVDLKILESLSCQSTLAKLKKKKRNKARLYISLDMDVLSHSEAPGCSQSFNFGLSAREVDFCLKLLTELFDLKLFGVYEVSPPLDPSGRTSQTAAVFMHQVFHTLFDSAHI